MDVEVRGRQVDVNHHRSVRERDLGKLSDMHARDLSELKDERLLQWRPAAGSISK